MAERFSASVAARIMACPPSANLELALAGWVHPVEDRTADNAANRGTTWHEYFANIMSMPNADMQRMVQALQYVADLRRTRRFKVLIEQTVKATWLQTEPDTAVDLVFYTQDEIHVIDLKTGKIPVEVWDNAQLLYYGTCFAHLAPRAKGVNLHIVQPWADNMEHWFADTNVIKQFMAEAQAAEAKVLAGDITSWGPSDHCKFCPAYPHARGAKGNIMCPATMQILYPSHVDEDEILGL